DPHKDNTNKKKQITPKTGAKEGTKKIFITTLVNHFLFSYNSSNIFMYSLVIQENPFQCRLIQNQGPLYKAQNILGQNLCKYRALECNTDDRTNNMTLYNFNLSKSR
ncbi:hypothetical protein Nmel_015859, partial [Mimus melanotis]